MPAPGSIEESERFRAICIEIMLYPEDVRRCIIGEMPYERATTIAMAVLRCPTDIRRATWRLATLVGRCVPLLLVSRGFLHRVQRLPFDF